jgi:hypothetical protein
MPHTGLSPAPANMRVCMSLHYVRNYVRYVVPVYVCVRMCLFILLVGVGVGACSGRQIHEGKFMCPMLAHAHTHDTHT